METIKIKLCSICKSGNNKFQVKRNQCNLCLYQKYPKSKEYMKKYYIEHKEQILENQDFLYHTKYKKSLKIDQII